MVNPTYPPSLERAMVATHALEGLPRRDVRDLMCQGTVRRARRGAYLFFQGDDAKEVFFLFEGRVEISSLSQTGSRGLHTAIERPQFFGELGVLAGRTHTTSALAIEESDLWTVRGDTFVRWLGDHPRVAIEFLRALARQVQEQEGLVDDLLFLDLKGRVAKRLLGLVSPRFDELPRGPQTLPSIVTHADLASLAGGSRENVTRILSDFQKRGLVARNGRRYVLKDIKALRRLARV